MVRLAFTILSPIRVSLCPRSAKFSTRSISMTSRTDVLPRIVEIVQRCATRSMAARATSPILSFMPSSTNAVPDLSLEEVAAMKAAVSDINPSELGADSFVFRPEIGRDPDSLNRKNLASAPIGFCRVGQIDNLVDIAIFLLPPGKRMPIHNHPHMHVFSRVLFGRMQVDEFDPDGKQSPPGLLSVQRTTAQMSKGDVRVITPVKGNIHSFMAVDWTAVFDVAVPPYEEDGDRPCSYFTALDSQGRACAVDEVEFLAEVDCPRDYVTTPVPYRGEPLRR